MDLSDRVKKSLADYPEFCSSPDELTRLEEFLKKMKEAGIAKTREYDLPLPDTLGRAFVMHGQKQEQS
jgi:hypothetical protein